MFDINEFDIILREITSRWCIPGLAVGLVEDGQIVYTGFFGMQSLDTRDPVTPESIFCTASVSKCFTAATVMQLAERGKISLDAPAAAYLPYFQLDDERYIQMTIRQMLSHTSGMPDLDEAEYDELVAHPEWDEGAMERLVRSLRNRKMIAAPGERFSYSNLAYDVLGDVIAKVSGKSFEAYMRDEILLPAGMPDSTFLLTDVPADRLAVPHLRTPEMMVNPVYPYHRADAPASFLHSTIGDMCHWAVTSLNRGKYGRQSILSPTAYDLMWSTVIGRGGSRPGMYEDMGLGWTLGHHRGVKTVSHGGMGFGWTDFLLLLPEKNSAAVVLCNEESFARTLTVRAAADTLLDIEPQAGKVSWMVPVSRAISEGGIHTGFACYERIRDTNEYSFDEDDLANLAIQLTSVKKYDLAIDVLGLNIHVFPAHVESYIEQAKLYRIKNEREKYMECIDRALKVDPENQDLAAMRKSYPN